MPERMGTANPSQRPPSGESWPSLDNMKGGQMATSWAISNVRGPHFITWEGPCGWFSLSKSLICRKERNEVMRTLDLSLRVDGQSLSISLPFSTEPKLQGLLRNAHPGRIGALEIGWSFIEARMAVPRKLGENEF